MEQITRSSIEHTINEIFDGLEVNNFAFLGMPEEPVWERPLIGAAAGDDPYYLFLKEHIGEFHMTPAEAFAQKYGEAPEGKLSVMSIAFPQTAATKDMQRQADVCPCDEWIVSRSEWETLAESFCRRLEAAFEKQGIRCVCPELLDCMKQMRSDSAGLASNWSQRHTAYAAGLGTFGLSDGFITSKGIAVRFTSIILEADIPADGKVSEDPYGWCNKCGACISRCPAGAISAERGHDKEACAAYKDGRLDSIWPEYLKEAGYTSGCGLCQAGVPCSDRPPKGRG